MVHSGETVKRAVTICRRERTRSFFSYPDQPEIASTSLIFTREILDHAGTAKRADCALCVESSSWMIHHHDGCAHRAASSPLHLFQVGDSPAKAPGAVRSHQPQSAAAQWKDCESAGRRCSGDDKHVKIPCCRDIEPSNGARVCLEKRPAPRPHSPSLQAMLSALCSIKIGGLPDCNSRSIGDSSNDYLLEAVPQSDVRSTARRSRRSVEFETISSPSIDACSRF